MIWVGTSGWVYPHWRGRFYPPALPASDWLALYARAFATVEINRTFYRLPRADVFRAWAAQAAAVRPHFRFAVKASRYLTHQKKLRDAGPALQRMLEVAAGLGEALGPLLFQLPPRWRANPARLAALLAHLPPAALAAFEFRDPSWYIPAVLRQLDAPDRALAIGIGGPMAAIPAMPPVGAFGYIRVHAGAHAVGLTDTEVAALARHIAGDAAAGRDTYCYFNNDPDGHAIMDAQRLRAALASAGLPLAD